MRPPATALWSGAAARSRAAAEILIPGGSGGVVLTFARIVPIPVAASPSVRHVHSQGAGRAGDGAHRRIEVCGVQVRELADGDRPQLVPGQRARTLVSP